MLHTQVHRGCRAHHGAKGHSTHHHLMQTPSLQRGARGVARAGVEAPLAATAAPTAPEPTAVAEAPLTSLLSAVDLPSVSVPAVPEAAQQAAAQLQDLNSSVAAGVTDKAAELAGAASKATSTVTASASKAAEQLGSAFGGATSSVADTLSGATSSVTNILSGSTSSVTNTLSGATSSVTKTLGGATSSITGTLSGLSSGVSSNINSLKSSLGQGVSGVTSSLGQGVSGVTSQVGSLTGQVGDTVGGTLSGVQSSLGQATAGVSGAVGSAVGQFTASTKAATDAVGAAVSGGTAAVQQTLDGVSSQVAAVTSQVASSVDATTQQVLGSLPPPVKDALVAAGGVAAAAGGQVVAHPRVAAVLAVAVGVPTAYSYYKGRYGGYAGEASPDKVYQLLNEDDNIFLVDIRPEEQREKQGLPQLKRGARFKVAAFPLEVTIPPRVAREAANAEELRLQVNAAFITGLAQCQGPLTKLIIMDSTGSDKARALARALTSLGQPLSYVMTGGFSAWAASELPVLEGESEYDASTGAVLSDNVEVLAEKANEAVKTVAQPQVGLPLLGGSALAAYAALNIHTTLEFIGVLGVLLTIVNKALSYDSPQAALDDAKGSLDSLQKTLNKLGSVKAPSIKAPSMPSMPKMPGQAAAVSGGGSSGGSSGAAAGAALSAAALAGGSGGRSEADVGEETEQELVD